MGRGEDPLGGVGGAGHRRGLVEARLGRGGLVVAAEPAQALREPVQRPAHGYRGQRIFVIPDREMVVVFTADLPGNVPSVLLSSFIIPAARSSEPLPENPEGVALLKARIDEIGG